MGMISTMQSLFHSEKSNASESISSDDEVQKDASAKAEVHAEQPVKDALNEQPAKEEPLAKESPKDAPAETDVPVEIPAKEGLVETALKEEGGAETPVKGDALETASETTAETAVPAETPAKEAPKETATKEDEAEPAKAVPKAWNAFEKIQWPKFSILGKTRLAEQSVREWIATYGTKFDQFEFAFDFVAGQRRIHVVSDDMEVPSELWFVGDIHGDILALDAALSLIDSRAPHATILFLGDLFDRFEYGIDVVMRVIALIKERPGRIFWIAGNHDDGLFFDKNRFCSKVIPSEFCQFLNLHKEYEDFGKWLIEFCKILPRALFLPDGLFIAHGGCPSFDWNTFAHSIDDAKSIEDLENEKYLHSFIWNRVIPGQDDKSEPEVGKNDLIHFMERMRELTGLHVKRMLRGHDHCKETRHDFIDSYYPQVPVLTLSTMSAWYLGSGDTPPELNANMRNTPVTTPAIARYRYDELPEVFTLDIPLPIVQQFHKVEELMKDNEH